MITFDQVTRRLADRTAGAGQLILDGPTGQITVLADASRGGGRVAHWTRSQPPASPGQPVPAPGPAQG